MVSGLWIPHIFFNIKKLPENIVIIFFIKKTGLIFHIKRLTHIQPVQPDLIRIDIFVPEVWSGFPSDSYHRFHDCKTEKAGISGDFRSPGCADYRNTRADTGKSDLSEPCACDHRRAAPVWRQTAGNIFGTFTPTSTTVVDTSTCISFAANRSITSFFCAGFICPCKSPISIVSGSSSFRRFA